MSISPKHMPKSMSHGDTFPLPPSPTARPKSAKEVFFVNNYDRNDLTHADIASFFNVIDDIKVKLIKPAQKSLIKTKPAGDRKLFCDLHGETLYCTDVKVTEWTKAPLDKKCVSIQFKNVGGVFKGLETPALRHYQKEVNQNLDPDCCFAIQGQENGRTIDLAFECADKELRDRLVAMTRRGKEVNCRNRQ